MDKVTLDRIQLLLPKLRKEGTKIYEEICESIKGRAMVRFTSTLRTFDEQAVIFAQGRTAPGRIVTNARPGRSYHNYGMAIDIALILDKDGNGSYETASWDTTLDTNKNGERDWMEVVAIFKQYGWTWGGDWRFKDNPHFQKTFGLSTHTLEHRYNNDNILDNGIYYPRI